MKTFAAVLAFACLAQCALASVEPKKCPGGPPSTSCSAVSTLQIEVTRGKCRGTSSANCKTWSQSQEVFQEAFEEWWSEGETKDVCDGNKVDVAAQAVATAIAKVWTSAAVDVECDDKSQGFSCGWSFANGETFGVAVAEAVATAAADASLALEDSEQEGSEVADAFCFADVRAISGVFTQAASDAAADACTGTGQEPASVYESSFVSSIKTVVADAFASASARVCRSEDGADVTAESLCQGVGEVSSAEKFEGDGNFCFGFSDIPACEGLGGSTCCSLKPNARSCRFNKDPKCTGSCRKNTWRTVKAEDGRKVWRDQRSNVQCFCKDN
ncbi:hypothetical protein BSKO_09781 [Bryopsis sp. KO-2023]|nr:hypothetical protein BSKO_09781 [Bryopsis sp. KO-2023]